MKFKRILVCLACLGLSLPVSAFNANTAFTVTLAKVNSNGTATDIETQAVTSDSTGKISFSFSDSVPTNPGANFLVITVKNAAGVIVRQSLCPAPSATETAQVGVNGLSDVQSKAILDGFANAGSDDPIYGAFGFMLLRSSKIDATDRGLISSGGQAAILGTGGFVPNLSSEGISDAALTTFRNNLVSNTASGTKDLTDYSLNFKNAIDNSDDTLMSQAGGFIADIFIDAANAAEIDLSLILSAFEAAGSVAESNTDLSAVSSSTETIMNQAIMAFFQRIAAAKVRREYSAALATLGATGDQVDRFNSAVSTLLSCMNAIFESYHDEFENQTMTAEDQTAMNTSFTTCFNSYTGSIRSTGAEISSIKSVFAAAMGLAVDNAFLDDFGSTRDLSGNAVNWPIPELVQHSWLSSILNQGGTLTYSRDTLAIPDLMSWLSGNRSDFTTERAGAPGTLLGLLGLKEDVQVIQFTFYNTFAGGGPVTRDQEQSAKLLLSQRLEGLLDNIGGSQNTGGTDITDGQKRALIKMMLEPDFN